MRLNSPTQRKLKYSQRIQLWLIWCGVIIIRYETFFSRSNDYSSRSSSPVNSQHYKVSNQMFTQSRCNPLSFHHSHRPPWVNCKPGLSQRQDITSSISIFCFVCLEIECLPFIISIPSSNDVRAGVAVVNVTCPDGMSFAEDPRTWLMTSCSAKGSWIPAVPKCVQSKSNCVVTIYRLHRCTSAKHKHTRLKHHLFSGAFPGNSSPSTDIMFGDVSRSTNATQVIHSSPSS